MNDKGLCTRVYAFGVLNYRVYSATSLCGRKVCTTMLVPQNFPGLTNESFYLYVFYSSKIGRF